RAASLHAAGQLGPSLVATRAVAPLVRSGGARPGKSTLLNAIGLLDRPMRGRVVVDGQDTTGLDDASLTKLRARTLGFVFQFHHLLPMFTALENIMLPAWGDEGGPGWPLRARQLRALRRRGPARPRLPHARSARRGSA